VQKLQIMNYFYTYYYINAFKTNAEVTNRLQMIRIKLLKYGDVWNFFVSENKNTAIWIIFEILMFTLTVKLKCII